MGKKIDLTNHRFGRLVVLKKDHVGERGRGFWLCRCDCGNEVVKKTQSLTDGRAVSCGCRREETKEEFKTRFIKHGMRNTLTYSTWRSMNTRCKNAHIAQYNDYGGRGISICDRWKCFENFFQDMGERPQGTSLDRIDNNGDYCKENCRWSTREEQGNNTRKTTHIEFNGKIQSTTQWSNETGIEQSVLCKRLQKWTVEKALTTPVRKINR